ncbi:MAG: DUF6443 domain-containing protein [Bacteroidota bacterium]
MQRISISIFCLLLISLNLPAQNWGDQNYVAVTTARAEVNSQTSFEALSSQDDKNIIIQYVDGLGRPIQDVDWKSSPLGNDVISFHEYDASGREEKQYLPFTKASSNNLLSNPATEQYSFYNLNSTSNYAQSNKPFALTQFEASPLNRVIEQGAPGVVWQPAPSNAGWHQLGEHSVVSLYEVNFSTVDYLPLDASVGASLSISYAPGELSVQKTHDENWNWSEVYTDKLGRTILSKVQDGVDNNNYPTYATTAYVYDVLGRVKYVIQPEGWEDVVNDNLLSSSTLENYAFQYEYDARNRVIKKKVPGADWVYMIYNKRNELVYAQDGAQRNRNEWSFTKYDALGRPIITGLMYTTDSQSVLQSQLDNSTLPLFEEKTYLTVLDSTGEDVEGYSNHSYPLITGSSGTYPTTVHSVTYYDTYDFDQSGTETGYESTKKPSNATDRTRGMVTGIKVRILNPDDDMPVWLYTKTYYDDRGREIRTLSDNHFNKNGVGSSYGHHNKMDYTTNTYNFIGELTKSETIHYRPDGSRDFDAKTFTYDHRGRTIRENEELKVNLNQKVMDAQLAYYDYNELGQMVGERLGPTDNTGTQPLQYVDYEYNIRGWLESINGDDRDCASRPDIIPPAAITDLEVTTGASSGLASGIVKWTFTAPGDDYLSGGNVSSIEVCFGIDPSFMDSSRKGVDILPYRTNTIYDPVVNGAINVGQVSSFQWSGFQYAPYDSTKLYFALRTRDEAGNVSPFSNVVIFTPLVDVVSQDTLPAESFLYVTEDCATCEENPGTALELKINSWDITFDVSVDGGGNHALDFTVTDQKDLISYKPGAGGMVAQDVSYSFSRSVAISSGILPSNFPETYPYVATNSNSTLPYSFSYKDLEEGEFDDLELSIQETIEDALTPLGFGASTISEVVSKVNQLYLNDVKQKMNEGGNIDLFSMRLYYNEGMEEVDLQAIGQYNGNISGMKWKGATDCNWKGYGYTYDPMNRLKTAYYGEYDQLNDNWTQNVGSFHSEYTYDKNGNIETLRRFGYTGSNSYGLIDDLTYSYSGNQLTHVQDGTQSVPSAFDFFDNMVSYGPNDHEYLYDASGNMKQDDNRSITATYNHFNKPIKVNKGGDGIDPDYIKYIYAADGTKLRQKVYSIPASTGQGSTSTTKEITKITDYVNAWQYEDADGENSTLSSELIHVITSKGRMVPISSTKWIKEYFLKDHLGNTRVVFGDYDEDKRINPDPTGTDIMQTIEGYYPFGLAHNSEGALVNQPENQYLYNGKEKQDELNLGWYDYGARMFNPATGRWGTLDPKADLLEKSSPYVYSFNSPIVYIDPDGELPILINGRASTWIWAPSIRKNGIYWGVLIDAIRSGGRANPSLTHNPHRTSYGWGYNGSPNKITNSTQDEFYFVDGDQYAIGPWNAEGWYDQGNIPAMRRQAGLNQAKKDFKEILSRLARDPESGKIIEKIQIYSHSRGAAFAVGYIEELLELISTHSDQFADPSSVIEFVLHMNPHQSYAVGHNQGVPTVVMHHDFDGLSGNSISGVFANLRSNVRGHLQTTFNKEVQTFLNSFYTNGGATQATIDNFIETMRKKYDITVKIVE